MKRAGLGLLVVVLIALVFGTESILAVLRQRNLEVTVQLVDAQGVASTSEATDAAPQAAPANGTPAPISTLGTLPADGSVVVNAKWDYRIGPRFPQTTVRAQVTDSTGVVVASDEYSFDCASSDSMQCNGSQRLTLNFGVKNKAGTRSNWPAGGYNLIVTRAYADLKA